MQLEPIMKQTLKPGDLITEHSMNIVLLVVKNVLVSRTYASINAFGRILLHVY